MMTEQAMQSTDFPGAGMDRRVARSARPFWRRRIFWIAAGLGLAALLIWRMPAGGSVDMAAADLETGMVRRAPFADYLPVRAVVAPRISTLVGVLSGGQVEKLLVQDGALVSEGQPLAQLSNPALELDVLTREAQIASQLGGVAGEGLSIERSRLDRAEQIAQASYSYIKAKRDLAIREQLRAQGFLSDEGVASYAEEAAYQEKRLAQLRAGGAAEAGITRTQAARLEDTRQRLVKSLAALRAGRDALVVRAPAAGRLTNFTLQPGQSLKAGDPAGQVDSEGSWKLEADVDEYHLGRVATGQAARFAGGRLTVARVLPTVRDGRFRVELAFAAPLPGLNRGQTLDVRITLGGTAPALVAPVGGWLEDGGGGSVFVLDADGRHARRRAVRVGRRNPQQAEILSGLRAGERILLSNLSSVKGDVINIR